jgi:hypothetical protein
MSNPNFGEFGVPSRWNQFNQPGPEAKKKGWLKRKRSRALVQAMLELAHKGPTEGALRQQAAEYFGVEPEEITNEVMMVMRQIALAIEKGDTTAFTQLMDRAYGKPKEDLTVHSETSTAAVQIEQVSPESLNILTTDEEDADGAAVQPPTER